MNVPLRWVLALLVAAYLLPGLVGHDPWKADEPYTFGAALGMMNGGDPIVPMVGGQPFVEKPPLYYWLAAWTAARAAPLLPLHDGARLASLVFVLVALAATAGAARMLWGAGAAAASVLLFVATLGVEGHAQRMQVDLAMTAGFALALLGLAACIRDRRWGGALLGVGMGLGFLGKGLYSPAVIGISALLLPLFFREWRTRGYFLQLAYALAAAMPFLLIWPLALLSRSERLFREWIWDNNLGRFTGYSITFLGAPGERGEFGWMFAWFLFPTWIGIAAALFILGKRAWHEPGMQLGLTVLGVGTLALALSASMRAVYFLPLVPAAVLAAVASLRVPDGRIQRGFGMAAIAFAAAAALLVWIVWAMLLAFGSIPESLPLARLLPAHFEMPFSIPAVASALVLTVAFAGLVRYREKAGATGLTFWVASLALAWGLAHTLWLPWLDAARSYRAVFAEMAKRLPPGTKCIVMDGPGESERAMLEYFTGIAARERFVREDECGAILWKGSAAIGRHPLHALGMPVLWSGARPGDRDERFDLILRVR
jgi:4-amino-4-deoxy-L-arabinose transferase-like glycosyltransferase